MFETILSFISNPIGGITAAVTLGLVYKVAGFLYSKFAPLGFILKALQKPLNHAAYRIFTQTEKIKDVTLKNTVRNDLDNLGNKLDDAWDSGLRGEKW